MTDKQIIDRVNVKECKYYCNGKCERYEEFVEADYADYSVKCICEKENDLGTYDICDYQQLKAKEQECEELKKDLHQNFKEKEELHLIIDRLLEASGYDTNTASAEDFEDVYEHMRYEQQLDQLKFDYAELEKRHNDSFEQFKQLKAENEILKEKITISSNSDKITLKIIKTLTEIKEIAEYHNANAYCNSKVDMRKILQKCEVLDE